METETHLHPLERVSAVSAHLAEALEEFKPRLRGWLHAGTAPAALVLGIVLVIEAPNGVARFGAGIFAACSLMLFASSAALHRGRWSPRAEARVTRIDHASIFLLIAGSYTPFGLLLLEGGDRIALLSLAWGGALVGIAFRLLWPTAPRWVYTPVYLALGWVSIFFVGDFLRTAGAGIVALIAAGGLLYTVGAVVYGMKRPNPIPQWFGFHEVFHAFTVLAFVAHYTAVSLTTHLPVA